MPKQKKPPKLPSNNIGEILTNKKLQKESAEHIVKDRPNINKSTLKAMAAMYDSVKPLIKMAQNIDPTIYEKLQSTFIRLAQQHKEWSDEKSEIEIASVMTTGELAVLHSPSQYWQKKILNLIVSDIEKKGNLSENGNVMIRSDGRQEDYKFFYRINMSDYGEYLISRGFLIPEELKELIVELPSVKLKKEDVLLPLIRGDGFRRAMHFYFGNYVDENGKEPDYHILWDYMAGKNGELLNGINLEYSSTRRHLSLGGTNLDKENFRKRFQNLPIKKK